MVRAALGRTQGRLNRGPVPGWRQIPALSVIFGTAIALFPIVSAHGWWPNGGLLMLLSWRLLRADAWPAWVAAPLGLVNDLVTGAPIGLSVALWPAFMLAMDVVDRRTMWRDYWVEWLVASLFILIAEAVEWKIAGIAGAPVRAAGAWPALLVAILCFPIAAALAARLDRWRLGQ